MNVRALVAALLALAMAEPTLAQPAGDAAEARYVGRSLLDGRGGVLGEIVQLLRDGQGRPAQVLVRPRGAPGAGLKSLPLSSLKPEGADWRTPLSRAEFDAVPPVQPVRS